jgi:hypothetical protein
MRQMFVVFSLVAVCHAGLASTSFAQGAKEALANDLILGTWDLDVAKSKFTGPVPKSETRTYVLSGAEIKATLKNVDTTGKESVASWTIAYDGRDRPQIGAADSDSVSFKRIDAYNVEFTQKRAGKTVETGTRVFSKDRKTMTITSKGTNDRGQPVTTVMVFVKR